MIKYFGQRERSRRRFTTEAQRTQRGVFFFIWREIPPNEKKPHAEDGLSPA
jgi:hypothetical protein